MKINRHSLLQTSIVFVFGILVSFDAAASIDNSGIMDRVLEKYSTAATMWASLITTRASWLFWTLVVISMVWTFGMMALRKADIGEFFAEFVKFTIFTGFYWWLLINGPKFAMSIVESMKTIASEAAGVPSGLSPSGVVDIGFDIMFKVLDQSSVWRPADSFFGLLLGVGILAILTLIAVNMLLLVISEWMLAYAGVFFLGFGGSRWTSEMAINYFRTVLNIGGQLLAMILIIGFGTSFIDLYYSNMNTGMMSLKEMSVMLVVALVLLMMVTKIPSFIGALGGGNTGALGHGFGAGALVAAAAMAAAAAATAGSAIAGAAASAGGGMQALMSAVSKANASESAGGEARATFADSGGGEGSSAAEASLARAMGDDGGSGSASDFGSAKAGGSTGDGDSGSGSGGASISNSPSSAGASSGATSESSSSNTGAEKKVEDVSSGGSKGSDEGAKGLSAEGRKKAGKLGTAGAVAAKTARVAAGTLANLAVGSWDVAKGNVSDLRDSAKERMANTTGGRIAAAIQARSAVDKAKFGDDSLSAAADDNAVDAAEEIAAFRDRGSI